MWAVSAQPALGSCGSSSRLMSILKNELPNCPAAACWIKEMAWLAASTQLPALLSKESMLDWSTGGCVGRGVGRGVGVALSSVELGSADLREQALVESVSASNSSRLRTACFTPVWYHAAL